MDERSALTDREEHALEAIRRQLDREFPHAPRGVVFAWHVQPEAPATAKPSTPPATKRTGRAGRVAIATGALLLAFALGAGTGVVVATLLVRDGAPAVERDDRRPAFVPAAPPVVRAKPAASSAAARPNRPLQRVAPPPAVDDVVVAPALPPSSIEREAPTGGRAAVEESRPSPPSERRVPESP
jgi:hypothetical protein